MKSLVTLLILAAGLLLSSDSFCQMSGTYTVGNGDPTTSFANFTGGLTSPGTISCNTSSKVVAGVGTTFTSYALGSALYTYVPGQLYCQGILIGYIATKTSATSVTLVSNAAVTLLAGSSFCGQDAPGAFITINTKSLSGDVILNLATDQIPAAFNTEPGTNALTGVNLNSKKIKIAGGTIFGANVVANAPGVIRLSGAINVTIDGTVFRNDKVTTATSPCLIFTEGANHNTIKNCIFETRNVVATAGGGVTVGAINFGTSTVAGGNSFNTIDNCTIRDRTDLITITNYGICSFGSTTPANYNVHNTIKNCTFDNIESYAIWITATGNGDAWTIQGNNFNMDKAAVPSSAQALIYFNSSTSNGNIIADNYNNAWSNSNVGPFIGIYASAGTTSATTITNNTIQAITLTTGASIIYGMQAAGGKLIIGGVNAGEPNTITGLIKNGSTAVASLTGIQVTGGSGVIIKNNSISSLQNKGTTTSPTYGINVTGGADLVISLNSITSLSSTSTGASVIYGINYTGTTGTSRVDSNTINTFTNAGTAGIMAGINVAGGSNLNINGNGITSLANSGTTTCTLYGINYAGTTGTSEIKNNIINTFTNAGTTGVLAGVYVTGGVNLTIKTNEITGLTHSGTGATPLYGVYLLATTLTNLTIYNNTINTFRNGGTTGTQAGIYNASTTSSPALSITYNNISDLQNAGTGLLYGIYSSFGTSPVISYNNISSLLINGTAGGATSLLTGIYNTSSGSTLAIQYNSITSFTNSAAGSTLVSSGISNVASTTTTQYISENTINTFSNTGVAGSTIAAIYNTGTGNMNIDSNHIATFNNYGLGTLAGIYSTAGANSRIWRNDIQDLHNVYAGVTASNNNLEGIYNTSILGGGTMNIQWNWIYNLSNTSTISLATGDLTGINNQLSTTVNQTIKNNTVTTLDLAGLGNIVGITSNTTTASTITLNVDSNSIDQINQSGTGATGSAIGINNIGAGVRTLSVSVNSITNLIQHGVAGAVTGILNTGGTFVNTSNNIINAFTTSGTGVCSLYGIYMLSTTLSTLTIYNNAINTFRNSGTTGTQAGIYNASTTSAPTLSVTYNIISDLQNAGTGLLYGIYSSIGASPVISYNNISSLLINGTAGGATSLLTGIYNISSGATLWIRQNSVTSFTNSATGSTLVSSGISNIGSTTTTQYITKNTINSFSNSGTSGSIIAAIYNTGTGNMNIDSNAIATFNNNGLGILAGIYSTAGLNSRISRNNIQDLHNIYSGATGTNNNLEGIYNTSLLGAGTMNIQWDTISNITNTNTISLATGDVTAINNNLSTTATQVIKNNIISGIGLAGLGTVAAITSNTATAGTITLTVDSNAIDQVNQSGTGATGSSIGINNIGAGVKTLSVSGNNITNLTQHGLAGSVTGISNTGNGVTSLTINGNNQIAALYQFGTGAGSAIAISHTGNGAAAISIKNNVINSITLAGSTTLSGIYITPAAAAAAPDIQSNQIYTFINTGNGTTQGILLAAGTTPKILSNSIYDFHNNYTGITASANLLEGIKVTTTTNADIESNTITSFENKNTLSTGQVTGINTTTSGTTVKILTNTINTFNQKGTGALVGIMTAPAVTGTITTISGNGVSAFTKKSNTTTLTGIACATGTGVNAAVISGNSISGLIDSNNVVAAGSASSVCGIYNYTTGLGQNVYNNTISDLQNRYAGPNVINITGIALNGTTANTTPFNVCARNNILITGTNVDGATLTAANLVGIDIIAAHYDVVNNMIMMGDVTGVNTNPYTISGIKRGVLIGSVEHIYFNNVYIVGRSSSGASNTYCYNSNAGTSAADLIKNNIFYNKRSNTGSASGVHYAMFYLAANIFDYNDYFTGGTGGLLSNGANSLPLKAGQDVHSVTVDPFYKYSTTLTSGLGNLHVYNKCALGGKGTTLSGNAPPYIEDGFGVTPRASSPNIGADEFSAPYNYSATTINPSTASINKCSPTPVQLTASTTYCSAVTYAWSPAGGLSSATIFNPTANPTITTTYTVVATDASLNTSSATVVVTLDPSINLGNASVCVGGTSAMLPYDGTSGFPDQYSIVWDATAHSAGLSDITNATLNLTTVASWGSMPIISFTVPGSLTSGNVYNGTFSVRISGVSCSSAGIPFTLTVVSGPPPPVDFVLSQSPSPANEGDNVTLINTISQSTPPAFIYYWFPIDISGIHGGIYGTVTNTLSDVDELTRNIVYIGAGERGPGNTWWITGAENACNGTWDQGPNKYSYVVPKSTKVNPTSCGSSDGSISFPAVMASTLYDITYTKNGVAQTPITGLSSGPTGVLTITGLGTGTYSITITSQYYLAVTSAPASVVLSSGSCAPTAYAVTGGTACGTATVGVANSQTGVTYRLYLNASLTGSPVAGSTGNSISFGAMSVAGTYTVIGTDGSSNTTLMTGSAVVNTVPTVNSVTSQTICNSTNTTAITFSGTGTSYTWANTATSIGLAASGSGNISAFSGTNATASPVTGTITVTPHTVSCDGNTTNFTFTVNPTPGVNSVTSQTVCNNTSVSAVNFSGTGTSYTWANTNTTIGLAASGTGNISSFTGTNAGSSFVTGVVTVIPHYLNNSVTCDGGSGNFNITINATPAVNSVSSQTVCNNTSVAAVAFSGTGTSYTWTNTTTGIGLAASGTGNISSFTGTNAGSSFVTGTVTVTPRYTNNSVTCNGSTTSFDITINATPTVNSVTSQTVCNNTSVSAVNFSGTGTSYTWANTNTTIGLAATGTGNISSFTGTNTGNSFIAGTVTATPHYLNNAVTCDGSTTNFTLTVNSTPDVDVVADQVVCNTGSVAAINFTGTGTSYTWANTATSIGLTATGTGNISSFTASNTGVSPVVATITATPHYLHNSITCDGNTITPTITVNRTPSISVSPTTANPCALVNTAITASGTSTDYAWLPVTSLDAVTGAAVNANPVSNIIYTVTGTDGNGCTNSTTSVFTVKPLPVVTVNPASAICTGTLNVTLTSSGAQSYTWEPADFINTSTGNVVSAQISRLTFYTVTGTGANGCTANSAQVPVATVPAGGASLPAFTVICNGTTTHLTTTGAAGNFYQWQISTNNLDWDDISGATDNNYTTDALNGNGKKYYRLLSQSNACYNIASTVSVVDISTTPVITLTNVTATSVTVGWNPYGSSQYNVSWTGAGTGSAPGITTNSFNITGLNSNEDVIVTITPASPICSGVSAASATTHTLCGKPTILNINATPVRGFQLTWSAVPGAVNYRIYFRNIGNSNAWSFVDVTGVTSRTFTNMGGGTFVVYVTAKDCPNEGNIGQGSDLSYVTMNPQSGCTVPTVTAISNCPNQISVGLSGGSGSYQLSLRRISPTISSGATYPINGSSANITVGTQYAGSIWEVFARNVCPGPVLSEISNVVVVTVKPGCATLKNLVLSHPTCRGFTATWNTDDCSGLGVSGYQVLIKKSTSANYSGYPAGVVDHIPVSWLNANTTYNVVVMSLSCNGATSAYSNVGTITTLACREEGNGESIVFVPENEAVVNIYPNPANDIFFIDINRKGLNTSTVKIELINQLGQVLQTNIAEMNNGHLNESINVGDHMASGIYFVKTTVDDNIYVQRLVISK